MLIKNLYNCDTSINLKRNLKEKTVKMSFNYTKLCLSLWHGWVVQGGQKKPFFFKSEYSFRFFNNKSKIMKFDSYKNSIE